MELKNRKISRIFYVIAKRTKIWEKMLLTPVISKEQKENMTQQRNCAHSAFST